MADDAAEAELLAGEVDALAGAGGFAGVVCVSRGSDVELARAYGLAERRLGVPMTLDTQFAIASATKGFTALTIAALIARGALTPDLPARAVLGADLPLIADDVTIWHLLTHRSGIGDYADEDAEVEAPLRVPVYELDSTEHYLPALDGFPAKFAAGERFSYCNSGYVVLALIAERVAGVAFADLVTRTVFEPAGMVDTAFPRSDDLPPRAAVGYLDDGRSNVFALPVVGSGDGGAYSTVADLRRFWTALFAGAIVDDEWVHRLIEPTDTGGSLRYGAGFWCAPDGPAIFLEGCDHGVSCRSMHDPRTGRTATVIGTTTGGAFPIATVLWDRLAR